MRRQAKPFAVEIRKSRRPAGAEQMLPPEESAPSPRFAEADRLLRLKAPVPEGETASDLRPRNVLPDLSISTAPAEIPKAPRSRKTATRATPGPELPSVTAAPAKVPAKVGRPKRTVVAPPAALSPPARTESRPAVRVETRRPTAASAPRRRDPRPERGEFLPGQRWKRRLAPILR